MSRGSGIEIKFSEGWLADYLQGKPRGKKVLFETLRRGMKKAGKGMQRDFVSQLYSSKLKKRTGELEKSFLKPGSLVLTGSTIGTMKLVFGSDSPAAWALEKGGPITPKKGKWLAWPSSLAKRRQFPGKTPARDFFQQHGRNALFRGPTKGLVGGIFLKIGKNRLEKWFHVAKQVQQPKRLFFERRTNRYWEHKGMDLVQKEMESLVGR